MKVIAVLEDEIDVGGGYNQSLNAILQMQRICSGRFEFEVFTNKKKNNDHLTKLGLQTEVFSISIVDKLVFQFCLHPWWHQLQDRLKLLSSFEKALIKHGCDLVYFVKQTNLSVMLQKLNFMTTLFDLCHRDAPEFPEVREFGTFQAREHYFNTHLTGAVTVLTDSPALADKAVLRYGIDRERLLPMPFSPAPFLDVRVANDMKLVLRKYELAEGYMFYPAQFWAHKNHIRILEALVILRDGGRHLKAVFAGGDKGNRAHVEKFVRKMALLEQVRVLGFVPAEDMRGLYEGCGLVVMPTYFGPTNLPPLEAWTIGKPLVYSSYFREQAGEAAICADPDDAKALALAMETALKTETSAKLIELGALQLQKMEKQRADAEVELVRRLNQFELRRKCWN